ncbi:MAG: histidinol dehydrogenase [Bacteroidales bacterium]|nr:histidinol dehydrogenase [Bacteroidales bacterium]
MKTILFPEKEAWVELCKRPVMDRSQLDDVVAAILSRVKSEGDKAVFGYEKEFDGVTLQDLRVPVSEIRRSAGQIPDNLKQAIQIAENNIEKFHTAQLIKEPITETSEGVRCWRKNVAIEKVGLYIPGGSAPLFSTVLMLAIPAKIAGCREVILCTPPDREGKINPLILYAALITGVTDIFRTGGAQAIAAMAYGTESIPGVYKIFGPGNQYVTKAKEMVQREGISIDMHAGPSELLVIAGRTSDPAFIASDLLSQAEHGTDSQVILLTNDMQLAEKTGNEVKKQILSLPRKEIAIKAMENSMIIILRSIDDCVLFSNMYAPEHLIINTSDSMRTAENVENAGSVFLGEYSCESAGDYASGTNHTLPTNGFARSFSGVSTDSFLRKITFQELTRKGIENLGPAVGLMAEAELLAGHKNSVDIRLKSIANVRPE